MSDAAVLTRDREALLRRQAQLGRGAPSPYIISEDMYGYSGDKLW